MLSNLLLILVSEFLITVLYFSVLFGSFQSPQMLPKIPSPRLLHHLSRRYFILFVCWFPHLSHLWIFSKWLFFPLTVSLIFWILLMSSSSSLYSRHNGQYVHSRDAEFYDLRTSEFGSSGELNYLEPFTLYSLTLHSKLCFNVCILTLLSSWAWVWDAVLLLRHSLSGVSDSRCWPSHSDLAGLELLAWAPERRQLLGRLRVPAVASWVSRSLAPPVCGSGLSRGFRVSERAHSPLRVPLLWDFLTKFPAGLTAPDPNI